MRLDLEIPLVAGSTEQERAWLPEKFKSVFATKMGPNGTLVPGDGALVFDAQSILLGDLINQIIAEIKEVCKHQIKKPPPNFKWNGIADISHWQLDIAELSYLKRFEANIKAIPPHGVRFPSIEKRKRILSALTSCTSTNDKRDEITYWLGNPNVARGLYHEMIHQSDAKFRRRVANTEKFLRDAITKRLSYGPPAADELVAIDEIRKDLQLTDAERSAASNLLELVVSQISSNVCGNFHPGSPSGYDDLWHQFDIRFLQPLLAADNTFDRYSQYFYDLFFEDKFPSVLWAQSVLDKVDNPTPLQVPPFKKDSLIYCLIDSWLKLP